MKFIFGFKDLKILRVIWWLFKPYKFQLIFAFVIMFLSGLLESINLAAMYPAINYGLEQESQGVILKFFNKLLLVLHIDNLFLASCVLLIIITIFAVTFKALNCFFSYKLMVKITSRCQKEIFAKYINADYGFFVRSQQGKLIHTGTIASEHTANMVLYSIRTINDILSLLLMLSLLIALTWKGTFLILVVCLFYFLVVKVIMQKIIYKCGTFAVKADREKNVILNELITGIKTIKAYLAFESWKKKYHDAVHRKMRNQFKMLMGRVVPESLIRCTLFVVIAGIGIFIYFRTSGDILPWIPLFGTFGLVASRLFPAAQQIGVDMMILTECTPNTIIVYDLFHENTKKLPEGEKTLRDFRHEICFQDVWFRFDDAEEFLFKGINFTIEKKKTVAIVGLSGNGKTTLINLLLRLYSLEKGQITIDSVDISEYTYRSYLSKIGYVGQETFVYNNTIKENIKFGMTDCSEDMVIKAARQANAHEFIINTPNGYDTIVGDAGIKLSGGQRQRIAIARAMLRKPEIMVLDEATSSLDNIAEKKVQDAIDQISRSTTVLIVAHRLSTVQNADKILVLNDGKIVEQGRHNELLDERGAYFRLYNMQSVGK